MALRITTRRTVDGYHVIGHLQMEISCISKFYYGYGGTMEVFVPSIAFRRSSVPQGGIEIPIVFKTFKSEAHTEFSTL